MEFSKTFKMLLRHPMTIPTLLMLFKSHSLSNKTPVKIPYKVLHKSTTIVVKGVDKHFQPKDILELFRRLHNDAQNIHEELAVYINTPSWDRPIVCYNDDDEEDCTIAITPILSTEEPDNSLSMGDEHLDTVSAMESDEFIKSSVEDLVPIPSESEGIPDNMCDVPFHDNSLPLDVSKDQFKDFSDSNDYCTLINNDSFSIDDIELHNDAQNIHEELAVYINTSSWDRPIVCYNDDDEEDCTIAITPILSTEEPDNSLIMGDEHLDIVSAMESDEFIKSSVEDLVPIPSESEGIPDNMCDVPFHDNSLPLDVSKDQFEDFSDSNDYSTLINNDSFSIDDIEYVEALPLNYELVSLKVMEIFIPKIGGIDDDILLTIKDDILCEQLLNINLHGMGEWARGYFHLLWASCLAGDGGNVSAILGGKEQWGEQCFELTG
nr:hypothetical protein [Tanacetum cinerariifolium]